MLDQLTYAGFLAVFLLSPLAGLAALRARHSLDPWRVGGIGLFVVLALAYTAPWDTYLVARGVWTYGDGRVAATLWRVPVEEYAFVALQTVAVGLWTQRVAPDARAAFAPRVRDAAIGVLGGAVVAALAWVALRRESGFYLGMILAWSAPVLALQWGVGWRYLWASRRRLAVAVGVPTLYLAAADRIAIAAGVWTLSPAYTTGIAVAGLPVEEAVFFLATNLFLAQGLFLYDWVVARWG